MQAVAADAAAVGRTAGLDDSLARAHKLAVEQGHATVALEHVLFALTDEPEAATILAASRVGIEQLRIDVSTHIGLLSESVPAPPGTAPRPGADLLRILQLAGIATRQSQRRAIDGGIVLAAIIGDGNSTAAGILKAHGLTFEDVIRVLQTTTAPRLAEIAPDPRQKELTAPAGPTPPAAQATPIPEAPAQALDTDILAAARARVKMAEPAPLRAPPPPAMPSAGALPTATAEPPLPQSVPAPGAVASLPPVATPPVTAALPPIPTRPTADEGRTSPVQPTASVRAVPVHVPAAGSPPARAMLAEMRQAAPPPPRQPHTPAVAQLPIPAALPRPASRQDQMPAPLPPHRSSLAPAHPGRPVAALPPMPALLPSEPLDIVRAAGGLPAVVRRNFPVLVEVRIPRQQVDVPRSLAPQAPPIFRAVTTRLASGPVSGLSIEPRTAETAWLGPGDGDAQSRDVVWQYVLTPIRSGVFAVTLTVSGRTISVGGMTSDVTATAETFAVRVKPERGRLSRRLLVGTLLLVAGGGIGWLLGGPLAGLLKATFAQFG